MIWHWEELTKQAETNIVEVNGRLVPARPIYWSHRSLRDRLVEALAVFIGTAEAFYWPGGQ